MIAHLVFLVALAVFLVMFAIHGAVSTGPGCPGDPAWLGWCSEVGK